jgi:hypothetical protein
MSICQIGYTWREGRKFESHSQRRQVHVPSCNKKKLLPQNLTWRQQLWHSHPAIWMTQGTRSILSFPSTILSLVRYQSGIMHNAMSYKNTIVGVTIGTRKQTICHFFACNNANCLLVFLINYISIYV